MGFLSELFGGKTSNVQKKPINTTVDSIYSSLTRHQRLAAMNLMFAFSGSCSGTVEELSKINHIMAKEGQALGITKEEMQTATSSLFNNDMRTMANALKGADKVTLEKLFWAFYCIIAAGKSKQAVLILLSIYEDFGFSNQDCVSILERRTGIKMGKL